jgi:enoyl-CoA hydratase
MTKVARNQLDGLSIVDHDGVRTLRMSRPETRNALDTPMVVAMADALDDAALDETVRCVILTGGEERFASGADLRELARTTPGELLTGAKDAAWQRVFAFPKPLVAAVAGPALGGGCELALSCDIVIAADDAFFGQPEVRLGIMPGAGGTQRWARAAGRYRAAVVNLTGETVSAWEAWSLGLVAEVVPAERLSAAADEWARRIARFAPLATRGVKAAVRAAESMPVQDAMRLEKSLMAGLLASRDAAEGIDAFLTRRKPVFEGR